MGVIDSDRPDKARMLAEDREDARKLRLYCQELRLRAADLVARSVRARRLCATWARPMAGKRDDVEI